MNSGPNRPTGDSGGRGRRRRRGRRGPNPHGPQQHSGQGHPGQPGLSSGPHRAQGQGPVAQGGPNRRFGGARKQRGPRTGSGMNTKVPDAHMYSAPMDHSYRSALQNGNGGPGRGGRPGFQQGRQLFPPEPEPLPNNGQKSPKIFAFIDDLFFLAKINETARKLNLKVEFVKSDKQVLDAVEETGEKPSLIMVDLNNASVKPLSLISKLKKELKKETNIIGFLSHVQGDLKLKAQESGCDMVLPRSAFSANLPNLLRRHAASTEPDEAAQ